MADGPTRVGHQGLAVGGSAEHHHRVEVLLVEGLDHRGGVVLAGICSMNRIFTPAFFMSMTYWLKSVVVMSKVGS